MKISYETHNGKKYAYTCTSVKIPGKKNAVSKKNYLGTVDPISGEIIPKHNGHRRAPSIREGATSKSFGDVLLLHEIFNRTGLTKDIKTVFGDHASRIIALAMTIAIHPSNTNRLGDVIDSSCICEILDLPTRSIDSTEAVSIINSITTSEINSLFQLRMSRAGKLVTAYLRPFNMQFSGTNWMYQDVCPHPPSVSGFGIVSIISDGELLSYSVINEFTNTANGIKSLLPYPKAVLIPDKMMSTMIDPFAMQLSGCNYALIYTPGNYSEPVLSAL